MRYDTTTDRYSHLMGLTSEEIAIVMCAADTICCRIRVARALQMPVSKIFVTLNTTNRRKRHDTMF